MTNDERVKRVMQGMGAAEAPEGLEARVLARVATARGERRVVRLGWIWGMAVAAGLLVGVGVGVRGLRVQSPARVAARPAGAAGSEGVPPELEPVAVTAANGTAGGVPFGRARPASVRAATARAAAGASRREAAESFPAPPEPLTEQERLLLKVARNGDRNDDFALLNPEQVQMAFAQEKAEMAELVKNGSLAPMHGEFLK